MKKILFIAVIIILLVSVNSVSAEGCLIIRNTLHLGSEDETTGGEVTKLQRFLQTRNYYRTDITGYFGRTTAQALISFQRANGITAVGENPWLSAIVGLQVRQKIATLTCKASRVISISTPSVTALATPIKVTTPTPVATQTPTPVATYIPTYSVTPVATQTPTPVATYIPTYSVTPVATQTPVATDSPTPTATPTPSPTS
ncbi:MAG: hypothetical protein EXS50_01330 [Candidatus Taylorbacteria bacterium]|nr:hypothetical protein [Candidatus Taylorbacteria bacterium]